MNISNLANTPLKEIVECLSDSFSEYFVRLPAEVSYWENRFNAAGVDYSLSYGLFDDTGKLKGFIINAVRDFNGIKTAFNTGTGIVKDARGQKGVDRLYTFALPFFQANGIKQCTLEVITENHIAIHVYERIGFTIHRTLQSYGGTISSVTGNFVVTPCNFSTIEPTASKTDHWYSWDHKRAAIIAAGDRYKCYQVHDNEGNYRGYFILNPATNQLLQIEAADKEDLSGILGAVASIQPSFRIMNVDSRRHDLTSALMAGGLANTINQYEMVMELPFI